MRKSKSNNTAIPQIGEGKRGASGHIGYLLRQAHAAHRIRMEHALQAQGLTLPQFSVLTMLSAYLGASSAELARLSLLTPQTMTVIVANLERSGWVTRRPHAEHGRIQVIEITDPGRTLLARCKEAAHSAEATLLEGLSETDEAAVRRWLVQVAKSVEGA